MIVPFIMVDLETFGTDNNAAITAIGAHARLPGDAQDSYYTTCDPDSDPGCSFSAATIRWWLQQSEEARKAISGTPPTSSLEQALTGFSLWYSKIVQEHPSVTIWGNGADFDLVILASAFRRVLCRNPPWRHSSVMCFRTWRRLVGAPKPVVNGTAHHALDDAIAQANLLLTFRGPLETVDTP